VAYKSLRTRSKSPLDPDIKKAMEGGVGSEGIFVKVGWRFGKRYGSGLPWVDKEEVLKE